MSSMTWTGKPSKAHRTPRVFFRFRGRVRSVRAYKSGPATREMQRMIELLMEAAESGRPIPAEAAAWISQLDAKRRQRMLQLGLVSQTTYDIGVALEEHIDAWERYLVATGKTGNYATLKTGRARKMAGWCGWKVYGDIHADQALAQYERLKGERCAQTARHYLEAVKSFCRHMVEYRGAYANPLARVKIPKVKDTERTHNRAVLTPEQQAKLIKATKAGPKLRGGMTGPERALLYRLVLNTGFRAQTCIDLTCQDFALDGPEPTVTGTVKGGKRLTIPLVDPKLVADLKSHLFRKLPGASAFACPGLDWFSDMVRRDLERAGIASMTRKQIKEQGIRPEHANTIDFHALRTTFATTFAERGGPIEVLQEIMGHEQIETTRAYYVHVGTRRKAEALRNVAQNVTRKVGTSRPVRDVSGKIG